MITILIPAYNEEEVIEKSIMTLYKSISLDEPFEVLIVNDGSSDKTESITRGMIKSNNNLRLVNHIVNKGLGAALKTGFKEAKGRIIVTMDADLTHSPRHIKEMVNILDNADVCIASRYVKGGGMKDVPLWRVVLSKAANLFFQLIFFSRIKDMTAGYRAYKTDAIKNLKLKQSGFEIQLEITSKLIRNHMRVKEIPYILENRKIGSSKFNMAKMIPKYALNIVVIWFGRWFG